MIAKMGKVDDWEPERVGYTRLWKRRGPMASRGQEHEKEPIGCGKV